MSRLENMRNNYLHKADEPSYTEQEEEQLRQDELDYLEEQELDRQAHDSYLAKRGWHD